MTLKVQCSHLKSSSWWQNRNPLKPATTHSPIRIQERNQKAGETLLPGNQMSPLLPQRCSRFCICASSLETSLFCFHMATHGPTQPQLSDIQGAAQYLLLPPAPQSLPGRQSVVSPGALTCGWHDAVRGHTWLPGRLESPFHPPGAGFLPSRRAALHQLCHWSRTVCITGHFAGIGLCH